MSYTAHSQLVFGFCISEEDKKTIPATAFPTEEIGGTVYLPHGE